MNSSHPTADQLDRYRRRTAPPAELLTVDAHIAACDRCFAAVRADAHLTFEQTVAYVHGGADAASVERHLSLCDLCRGEVEDVKAMRVAVQGTRRRMPWLAAAAIVIFVLVAALLFRRGAREGTPPVVQTASAPSPAPIVAMTPDPPLEITLTRPAILGRLMPEERVLRGSSTRPPFALHAPVATVVLDDRPQFAWVPMRDAQSYAVVVADVESSAVAASGETEMTSWRPERPLPRGRTYAWQVTAHTGAGAIVSPGASGAEARFHVASAEVAAEVEGEKSHLDRGKALAERGALDDAERELQLAAEHGEARATSLLDQVRSWRARR